MEHRPLDWFKIIIYFQDKVSDTSVSSPYIFLSPKKAAWPLAEFDISCGITKAKTMTITSITKVGGEVSTITITRSSRLIVPSLAEITFTYLLDSLDWLRFSTVPSPRLRLLNAGSFREHWMILWLIWVKSEHLRRDWEIVNALTFHLHVNLANVYSRVRYTWKLPSVCDIIRITFAVRWVVGSKRTTKAILTIEMQSFNLSL